MTTYTKCFFSSIIMVKYFFPVFVDLKIIEDLKQMGPSAIDSEIRSLSLHLGGSVELLSQFLSAVTVVLKKRKDYEIVQAYLGLFLKIHCQSLGEHPELCGQIGEICNIVREGWTTLQSTFESTLCLVSFFINAVL
jgi:U3 small nucleolar RNA-associated protein 21